VFCTARRRVEDPGRSFPTAPDWSRHMRDSELIADQAFSLRPFMTVSGFCLPRAPAKAASGVPAALSGGLLFGVGRRSRPDLEWLSFPFTIKVQPDSMRLWRRCWR